MSELSYWHETTSLWAINIQNGKKKMFFSGKRDPTTAKLLFQPKCPARPEKGL